MDPFLVGIFFIFLGSFASLCNIIVIIVFAFDKNLRMRSQLFIALAVGDLLFALGFVINANHNNYESQAANQTKSVLSCWLQPHAILNQIGAWLCMTMTLALTLERACAVFLPYWYKGSFKRRHRYIAIALGCTATLIHTFITFYMAYNLRGVRLDTCTQLQSSLRCSSIVSIVLFVLNYIFCFCLNLFSYHRARAKSKRVNRELQRIKLISCISLISMMSVVLPLFVLFVHVSLPSHTPIQNSYSILVFTLIPIDSASNLFLYLWLKRFFRARAVSLLRTIICGLSETEEKDIARLRPNCSDSLLTNSKVETSAIEM